MNTPETYDTVVIGGGASGMMAAGTAAARGKRVLLLEKNAQLGEKLRISGGGRCNITNAEYDTRALLAKYGDAEQFLYSAFSQFGVAETFAFFEGRGLPLVVEARQRAFPASQKARDVCRALERYLKDGKVTVIGGAKVTRIHADGGRITHVTAGKRTYAADAYILATGGVSHPETGSTGDGFRWLETLGHTVVAPSPNIVPLAVEEPWVHALAGVSLSFMKITFFRDGKKAFAERGKLLFTHFGLSGPLILNAAQRVADLLEAGTVTARIDCYPDTDEGALERKILRVFDGAKNKMLKNVLDDLVPHGTRHAILSLLPDIDPETKVHSISKETRKRMVALLKGLPVTVRGLMGFDRAVVANGGVPLAEIDTRTMRSRVIENLYVTGDLLHITRPSGGYSLQLCWTTGHVAGTHA
jgi:predicted Rossmann fold flavoprotein